VQSINQKISYNFYNWGNLSLMESGTAAECEMAIVGAVH